MGLISAAPVTTVHVLQYTQQYSSAHLQDDVGHVPGEVQVLLDVRRHPRGALAEAAARLDLLRRSVIHGDRQV